MGTKRRASNLTVWTVLLTVCAPGGAASHTLAQDTCGDGIELLSHWDEFFDGNGYADIWAEGDVAYVGTYFWNVVHFFDISDPSNPVRFQQWSVPAPNVFTSAQDVKVHDGLLFIGLGGSNGDSVEIVDVRNPAEPVHLTWISTPGFLNTHNVFYDSGYLYLADNLHNEVGIVDLTDFDPDDPPERITEHIWVLTVGSSRPHDMTVVNGILYVAAYQMGPFHPGLYVYDVSNNANEAPVLLGIGPLGNATHSVWPSADGRWAVVGEERGGGPIKLYELIPNGDLLDIVLRDTVAIPGVFSTHNQIVVGMRVYSSWYGAGVRIHDIDPETATFVEVASFDPQADGFGGGFGTWGIYPLLGADRILVSDNGNGLFILDASGEDCDDGIFCNGVEACEDGQCTTGSAPCLDQLCRESDDQCVDCLSDQDCDNGAFCDGPETCDGAGTCVSGAPPCLVDQICLEESDRCVDCLDDPGCDDSEFCTKDQCVDGACDNQSILYGDVNLDGTVDLLDILCMLDGFAGNFKVCALATLDIADCFPNDLIDLQDILAVLDAFSGLETCCDGP